MKRYEATFLHRIDFEGDLDLESRKAELESVGLKVVSSYVNEEYPEETFLIVQGTKEQFEKDFSKPDGSWGSSWEDYVDAIDLKPLIVTRLRKKKKS